MEPMQDLNKTPPAFPLLVNQARSIALEMINNLKPLHELENDTRSKIALALNSMYHNAFWAGVHSLGENRSPEFSKCLETIYDQELQLYWTRFRKAKTPQLIRPVNTDSIKIDSSVLASKHQSLETVSDLLKPFISDTNAFDILMKNLAIIWSIVLLDASTLSDDYCSLSVRMQKAGESPDMRALMFPAVALRGYQFNSKTTMISENTFYALTGLTLLVSVGFYYYSRTKGEIVK
jgi:hypothetical protein